MIGTPTCFNKPTDLRPTQDVARLCVYPCNQQQNHPGAGQGRDSQLHDGHGRRSSAHDELTWGLDTSLTDMPSGYLNKLPGVYVWLSLSHTYRGEC